MATKQSREQKLDRAKEHAVALAFEGRWTQAEIAKRCDVSARTVWAWLNDPETQARIEAMRNDLAASLRDVVYAHKAARIVALSQMAEHARREYEAHPLLKERRPTMDGEIVNESFNRDAHAAFRGALDDIAKELGERSSNVNVSARAETLGVTIILEQMRHDRSIADGANDFLGFVAAVAEAQ